MPTPSPLDDSSPQEHRDRPLIFGEVLFDHFPDGARVLGGAPFNVAWHLRGFGADPILVTAIGDDPEGRSVRRRMDEWGLADDGVQVDPQHPTGHVTVHATGDRHSFEIGTDQAWDHLDPDAAEGAIERPVPFLYHGTLALRSEATFDALKHLLRSPDAPPTVVDLNLRDPWASEDRIHWCLSRARWLKLNESELARVTSMPTDGFEACRDAALDLAERHRIPRVVVTRGPADALCVMDTGRVYHATPPRVEEVADTVGAGDAFSAVLSLGILGSWSVKRTLTRAARFAADVCRIQGATTMDASLYERHLREWSEEEGEPIEDAGAQEGLYILSLSIHGLVRSEEIELGRDADTGGQVSYVVDEARALGGHPNVARVDVVTREIHDRNVDDSYAVPFEPISEGARIVRLPFGPRRYLRKESLWPYLDGLLDQLTRYVRRLGKVPDIVHGHYADAGYVGAQLAKLLGVPFFFTGHSLGRVKRARLLEQGKDAGKIEERYRLSTRIEAEERALETASVVIASTRQEVHDQYEGYDHYAPELMRVIPPGVDLSRFSPPEEGWSDPPIFSELKRFLTDPDKPIVLALARPDERKNFQGLIQAFGRAPKLRKKANLVLIAGNREDIRKLEPGPKRVIQQILLLIDRYDLYGSVAYPKTHDPADVPDLYRLAARSKGVFVNPALTEPFGLTLIEAAASGLPVVATDDGGPRDIVTTCENGLLVDAMEPKAIARGVVSALSSDTRWTRWSESGVSAAHESYSWRSHADRYVAQARRALGGMRSMGARRRRSRLPVIDRLVVTDVDDTLTGDVEALRLLGRRLEEAGDRVGFGIATGRTLERTLELIDDLDVPIPDVLITGSGTQLHYGKRLIRDRSWERQIHHRWDPDAVRGALEELPGVERGPEDRQTHLRLRYVLDPDEAPDLSDIRQHLRQAGLRVTTILDHMVKLDIVPVRASPGLAIRFFAFKWNLTPERLLVAGDSGNDADMLSGHTLGVVVGNHTEELNGLADQPRIYFAKGHHARGVLEGIEWYDFFGDIRPDRDGLRD